MIDQAYMARAIELAKLGEYSCKPNPMVGCVLVKDGSVVGEGYHAKAGQGHAEVNAISAAGPDAQGATAYVTLEPCAHTGRTGPCCVALVEAGVSKVIYGSIDPNPLVGGQGLAYLREQGVVVEGPVLEQQCTELNRGFFRRIAGGLPWVTTKIGASLDGSTAMASGESKWITGTPAREQVQCMRASADVLLSSMATVVADQPQFNVRPSQANGLVDATRTAAIVPPERWLVATHWPSFEQVSLSLADGPITIVSGQPIAWASDKLAATYDLVSVPLNTDGGVNLQAVLQAVADRGHNNLMVEAGAKLNGALFAAGLVDTLKLFIAPKLLGSSAQSMIGWPIEQLDGAFTLQFDQVEPVGDDLCITAQVRQ